MTVESNRQSIVTVIEQAKAAWLDYTLAIDYENRQLLNLADQVDPYLAVDIVYMDGDQLDLGPNPLVCDYGQIVISAGMKEGGGTAKLMALLDHFRPYLQLRDDIGDVRTQAARIHKGVPRAGFWYVPMSIPFWTIAPAPTIGAGEHSAVMDGGSPSTSEETDGGSPSTASFDFSSDGGTP
jgi:hypothetical protein